MKNKGITLVVLVITIILLLILAGITIMVVSPGVGELLSKSDETKEQARAVSVRNARDEWFVEIKLTIQMRSAM